MLPARLGGIDFLDRSGFRLTHPAKPTCYSATIGAETGNSRRSKSTIGYFLASSELALVVDEVWTDVESGLTPHRPVRLRAGFSDDELVPVLVKPKNIPLTVPFGPQLEQPDPERIQRLVAGLEEPLRSDPLSAQRQPSAIDMV